MDKRHKEARALIENGGFLCILLTEPFIDRDGSRDFSETDLSKRILSGFGIRPHGVDTRKPFVRSKVNELGKFFELYGAAWVALVPAHGDKLAKSLASVDGYSVSVLAGSVFAIPTLIPRPTLQAAEEYFTVLADGLVSLWERLNDDLPEWADEYRFSDEVTLRARRDELSGEISEIELQLKRFEKTCYWLMPQEVL